MKGDCYATTGAGQETDQKRRLAIEKWFHRIHFLLEHDEELNEWEASWLDTVDCRLTLRGYLTIRESFKLGQIFHQVEERLG